MELNVHQLAIGYHKKSPIISNIDFSINTGEMWGLIGSNGVGKTTLLKTICGLNKPKHGVIKIGNTLVSKIKKKKLAQTISIVLTQKPIVNLPVFELVMLGRYPYNTLLGKPSKEDLQQVENAIEMMEITDVANEFIFELSDGQLQKVLIARALAQDTDFVLLDEPTSFLDVRNKIGLMKLLRKVAKRNKGIIISTHEIELARTSCEKFICLSSNLPCMVVKTNQLEKYDIMNLYLEIDS